MKSLLDTGFLLAVLDADDELHKSCVTALLTESNPILLRDQRIICVSSCFFGAKNFLLFAIKPQKT